MEKISSNKLIAKNTIMLYLRMLLSIVVSLYTSRVVLEVLGVEDYGIYGVVGGVVAMFSFLNASMAGATSRFLTFEMGRGNEKRVCDTFSSAFIIHIGIALVVFILAETVGLWFLNNKLVIPETRMGAAHWVYQCSIVSTMLAITQVPYNALIIAHERMGVYAYVEILNVTLKLLIVFLLTIGDFDKLKLYAVLVLIVSVIIMLVYRIYCTRNFTESHFRFVWKKEFLKPMLSFTGWDFYGNMCLTARQQGTNFLINNFFGVLANAASGIVSVVNGVLSGFASNIITAFRPRIIKSYSQQNWNEMQSLMHNAIAFSTLLLVIITIPFFLEAHSLIQLWLGQVPEYVVQFVRITLITNCLGMVNSVVSIGIHATGHIKRISILSGTLFLIALPISYIVYKMGGGAESAYIVNLITFCFICFSNIAILKKQISEFSISSLLHRLIMVGIVSILSIIFPYIIYRTVDMGYLRLIGVIFASFISIVVLAFFIVLSAEQRVMVKKYICKRLKI